MTNKRAVKIKSKARKKTTKVESKSRKKKAIEWLSKYRHELNAVATPILILVTIALIAVTIHSSNIASRLGDIEINSTAVAERLGEIEIFLATERQKAEINENINIGKNLISEMQKNKLQILIYLSNIERVKSTWENFIDYLETLRLEQARERPTFGSERIRFQLEFYSDYIEVIKDDFNEMITAQRYRDNKTRIERIDNVNITCTRIIEGAPPIYLKIDDLIKLIEDYVNAEIENYEEIDEKLREDIFKFLPESE